MDALCKLCPGAGAREPLLGTFLHFASCKSQEASEFQPLLVGRAWRSGGTFGLDLLDFQSLGSVIMPSVTLSHVPCSQTDTAPKSSFMWREQWMIREVMWTLELKLRARMRGLKEAKRRI